MTPLLILILLAPSTKPTTINPHHNQKERTMAQPIHSAGGNPPQYHPPGHGPNSTAQGRVGQDARNPSLKVTHPIAHMGTTVTPTENTDRPGRR